MLPQPVGLRSPALHVPYIGKLKIKESRFVLGEEWGHMEPPSHKDTAALLSTTGVLFHCQTNFIWHPQQSSRGNHRRSSADF